MRAKLDIAVVHGGTSSESHSSTVSAGYVGQALRENGHNVNMIKFDENIYATLAANKPQLVFVAVQGKDHGDGKLQSICQQLGLPFTGSKAEPATVINDKSLCKKICIEHEILTPEYIDLNKEQYLSISSEELLDRVEKTMTYPVLSKAITQGGGFGIEFLNSRQDYPLIAKSFMFDEQIIIERFIKGRFVTSSVLEINNTPTVLPALSLNQEGFGENPINSYNHCFVIVDAGLTPSQQEELEKISRQVFNIFSAHNYARLDFILEEATGQLYFLEINAVPGLKPESFFPHAASCFGLAFNDLIQVIVENEMQGGAESCCKI